MHEQSAAQELARLDEQRARAAARVEEINREQRAAHERVTAATAAVAELERRSARGDKVSDRDAAERELLEATVAAQASWPAKREGATAAVRDCDQRLRQYVGENLTELVATHQARGRAVAERLNEHAQALLDAYREINQISSEISSLASMVGQQRPGDVSRTAAEALSRAAQDFLQRGGETAPTLLHDPRHPRHEQAVA